MGIVSIDLYSFCFLSTQSRISMSYLYHLSYELLNLLSDSSDSFTLIHVRLFEIIIVLTT